MVEEFIVALLVTVIVRPDNDHPPVSPVLAMVSVCAKPFPEKVIKSKQKIKRDWEVFT